MMQNQGDHLQAHAPYNFIPLSDGVIDGQQTFTDGTIHNGYFDVILTTETPLYIRGMLTHAESKVRDQYKNKPAFFYTTDENNPIIPGSSLRGMLRSLFEIVTFSKMDRVSKQRLFFRTVDNTVIGNDYRDRMVGKVESGYLTRVGDSWQITPCERLRIEHVLLVGDVNGQGLFDGAGPNQRPKWKNGTWTQHQRVWVKTGANAYLVEDIKSNDPSHPDYFPGILVITGNVPGKKKEFVFLVPDRNAVPIPVTDEQIKRFHDEDQISKWQEGAFPKDKPSPNARKKHGELQENPSTPGEPVFFLRENGDLSFFGRAQMFRLPYRTSPHDLLLENHTNDDLIDMTEAVFGFVRQKKVDGSIVQARSSRVFVTDGQLMDGQTDVLDEQGAITPPILSSPKPTTFQHYLIQEGSKGKADRKHYDTRGVKLRGQKMYWRQQIQNVDNIPGVKRAAPPADTQRTRLRAVNPHKQFKFRVEFENLNQVELGALAWVLTLTGMGDDARHMLGMGKPFGMGIVHLEAQLVLRHRRVRYTALFNGDEWKTGDDAPFDAAHPDVIKPFTAHVSTCIGTNFAEHERIQNLRHILKLRDPLPDLFSYMQLERPRLDERGNQILLKGRPQTDNEYKERPVLPNPAEVDKEYRRIQSELERQRIAEQPVGVGSRVSGKLRKSDSDEDYLRFDITSGKTEKPYSAAVPPDKINVIDGLVKNVIVEDIEKIGDTTYYWCRRETKEEREARRQAKI